MLMTRSIELRLSKRLGEALDCLDELLHYAPDFAPVFLSRATILSEMGRHDEGLAECNKYPPRQLATPELARFRTDMRDTAIVDYREKLQIDAANHDTQFRLANVYFYTNEYTLAAHAYNALLRAAPRHTGALSNLGYAQLMMNRPEQALDAYDRLLDLDPRDAVNHYNRGNVLKEMCRLAEAEDAYQRALQLTPDFAEAHMELAHCQLMTGRYDQGWRQFEWRWRTAQLARHTLRSGQPRWRTAASSADSSTASAAASSVDSFAGSSVVSSANSSAGSSADLSMGRATRASTATSAEASAITMPEHEMTLLLWAEQGYGDTLQFVRYAALAANHVGRVILRAPATLCELLTSLDPRIDIVDDSQPLPPHDAHCPLMSLPLAQGLDAPPPVADAAYLTPSAERIARWSAWLAPLQRARVGLVWAGSQAPYLNRHRDMPLEALLPLADLPVDFVCLQHEMNEDDAALWPSFAGVRPELRDFSDTAAIIAQLDLVISVDTAVAHLAGALNKPCCLLLRRSSEWRWQLHRSDTAWYRGTSVLRQSQQGDWTDVVAMLRPVLDSLIDKKLPIE